MLAPDGLLAGRCILVAEASYVLATTTCIHLQRAGALPLGPVPSVEKALLLMEEVQCDGAVLNSQLRDGEDVQLLADRLVQRRVPYVLLSTVPLPSSHPLKNRSPELLYASSGKNVAHVLAALLEAEAPSGRQQGFVRSLAADR